MHVTTTVGNATPQCVSRIAPNLVRCTVSADTGSGNEKRLREQLNVIVNRCFLKRVDDGTERTQVGTEMTFEDGDRLTPNVWMALQVTELSEKVVKCLKVDRLVASWRERADVRRSVVIWHGGKGANATVSRTAANQL